MDEPSTESSDLSWTTVIEDDPVNTSWSSHCKLQRLEHENKENRDMMCNLYRKSVTHTDHINPCGTVFSLSPRRDVDCNCSKHGKSSIMKLQNHSFDSLTELCENECEMLQKLSLKPKNLYNGRGKSVHFADGEQKCYTYAKELYHTESTHQIQKYHLLKACDKRKFMEIQLSQCPKSNSILTHHDLACAEPSSTINSDLHEKYACHICCIKFEHNHMLQMHVHHAHRGFARIFKPTLGCGHCGANFFRNKYLRNHLTCHHHTFATPTKK